MTQQLDPVASHRTLLCDFFRRSSDLGELCAPRAQAGTFRVEKCEELISLGLVEFDPCTGIAFQTSSDWDVVPTARGLEVLKER